ncbi:alpha/beta-hydrolase [Mollisia scopiformis]|uniref:Alpha/beta-hydrolase n=1 Tax=Mollisia scopiformis TaxID=149040 RepID=A0A132B5M4_MOLSC|nr:alpha/beta-hydrolase [Mollisia scopiformis]KUJ07702.1 alpha/beta-hydrolase [Mollisia scopiformis]
MVKSNLSREWQDFTATKPKIIDHEQGLTGIRDQINVQALENISRLKEPSFQALADHVEANDEHISLPEVDGHKFRVRIYKPKRASDDELPVMLYFHSGYWSTGNADTDELGCRAMIAHGNDLIVVSFEYRLIPEAPWNVMLSDAQYAVKWLYNKAKEYGGDVGKGFLVGGSVAGAHLAATSVIRARYSYPEINITGQCIIVPVVLSSVSLDQLPRTWKNLVTSHEENSNSPLLTEDQYQRYLLALNVPDDQSKKGENFPAWAEHQGLPSAYLAMDGPDPIRDEGYLYDKLLREAGVPTRIDHYELPNWFVQFPNLPSTSKAGMELAAGVRWLLEGNKYAL